MGQCVSQPLVLDQAQQEEETEGDEDKIDLRKDESLLSPRGLHGVFDGVYVDPKLLSKQLKHFRVEIQKKKLAPFWPAEDEETEKSFEFCPICACYYRSVNMTKCCQFKLCSECHERNVNGFLFSFKASQENNNKKGQRAKPTCVCCRKEDYKVLYRGVQMRKEREQIEKEQKQVEISLERAKVGVEEETRRRQSLTREGKGDGGEVPKGWEEEYSMARLAEEGGSPRAREEVAERSFGRVAWDSNGRNSSSASSLTPSQRISLKCTTLCSTTTKIEGVREVGEVWIWVQEGIHKTFEGIRKSSIGEACFLLSSRVELRTRPTQPSPLVTLGNSSNNNNNTHAV